jgi:uncharacterized protein YjaZ
MLGKLILLASFIVPFSIFSQSSFTNDPLKAEFVTSDIHNFWKAFESFEGNQNNNPFLSQYVSPGSPGILGFMESRIISADSLLSTVKQKKQDYLSIKENSYKILDKEKQSRAAFYALKYWYPQAIFPPVYFVIGRFNSGGHSDDQYGLIIGAEKVHAEDVPFIVAHELVHFQQKKPKTWDLLAACINEGTAEFLGELISGGGIDQEAFKYGNEHEKELWKEFKGIMDDTEDNHEWLYTPHPKNGRPSDLGYWMGYKIVKYHFDHATDKKQAVKEMLEVTDFHKFLKTTKYGEQFN